MRQKILITGARGGLAETVVSRLARRFDLVGVDPRPLRVEQEFPGVFYQIDYRQRRMADVFRNHSFHALLHVGRVPVTADVRKSARYHLNVLGTRNLLDLAARYAVKNVVVVSTFHVYGAHHHNHLYINEDDPLRASQTFPELSDAVELDNVSTLFMLKHRDIRTVVLRPTNVIGPKINNTITKILANRYCPVLMGYDPLQQFIHEEDMAQAMELALESDRGGVYNVSGEGVIPFTRAIKLVGATPVPVPTFLGYPFAGLASKLGSNFPVHLLDYFRYPTVLTDAAFRRDFGYAPAVSTVDALKSISIRPT